MADLNRLNEEPLFNLRAERPWALGKPAGPTEELDCSGASGEARCCLLRLTRAPDGELSRTLRILAGRGVNAIHSEAVLRDLDGALRGLDNDGKDRDGKPLSPEALAVAKADVLLALAACLAKMAGKAATFSDPA